MSIDPRNLNYVSQSGMAASRSVRAALVVWSVTTSVREGATVIRQSIKVKVIRCDGTVLLELRVQNTE